MASSYTAGSTQPLLTDPAIFSPARAMSVAPRGRGAEPVIRTTVAMATGSALASHCSSSAATSFIGSPRARRRDRDDHVADRIDGLSRCGGRLEVAVGLR